VPRPEHTSRFLVFGTAICLGAFLLFEVQLILGKYIFPGLAACFCLTSCMLVFQVLLLLATCTPTFSPPGFQEKCRTCCILLYWVARWLCLFG